MTEISVLGSLIVAVYLVLGYKKPALAFTTVPAALFLLGYIAVATGASEVLLALPVLFIGTLIAVVASGRDPQSRQWFHWAAWWLLIAIGAMLLLGAILTGFSMAGAGYVLPVIFILGCVVIFASLISYGVVSRWTTAINVFSTIGASIRQNLPLAMALECAAPSFDDVPALILRGIKTWLVKGCSLTEAVRRGYPQCPSSVLAMLSAGEAVGQLPAVLTAIETDLRSRAVEPRRLRPVHPFYPVVVVGIVLLLATGLLTFVVPQFQAVLQEMVGGPLPRATRILGHIAEPLIGGQGLIWLLGLILLAVVAYSIIRTIRIRRTDRFYVLVRLWDALKWQLPVVHRFERDRSLVQALELLRISLNAGRPVNEAIRGTLELDVNASFRGRLQCWLARVEEGQDIAESARRCGIGAAVAWAFDAGVNASNTPAILEMLESHHRTSYLYRLNLTRYILWPAGMLLLGVMVGFVAFAFFSPVVAVISEIASQVYP